MKEEWLQELYNDPDYQENAEKEQQEYELMMGELCQ